MNSDQINAQNRRSWNAVTPVHAGHRGDQAAFFRAGGSTLFPEERALLGELQGRRVAHLLCNAGQDSLSLALLGAQVTAIDFSDAAIEQARTLAAASNLSVDFVCAEVMHWLAAAPAADFDIIYAGYGVICWLADLELFAAQVRRLLRPAGRFVLMEFHPFSNVFDAEWRLAGNYPAGGALLPIPGIADYVGTAGAGLAPAGFVAGTQDYVNPEAAYLYRWGLGEVVSALCAAGLQLLTLREYCYVNGERPFVRMQELPGRRLAPPADLPAVPLMYGLAAQSP